jgi:enterochelin esterase-like enzyme
MAAPVATSTSIPPTAQPTPPPPTATAMAVATSRFDQVNITSQALAGNLLGDPAERNVYVVLPPGHDTSGKRYPVLYVMPWGNGDPTDNAWGFRLAMDSLVHEGEIPGLIVVVPDGTNKLQASQFRSSPTIGDYETYVSQEIVNHVDAHYRTLAARESRGVAGCSNGASASMRLGLKYPSVFSAIAATDGGYDDSLEVWPNDVKDVQDLKKLPADVSDLNFRELTGWYVEAAAGTAPDPNNPPFYCEMPFRIVNGRGNSSQRSLPKSSMTIPPTQRAGIYSSRSGCEAFRSCTICRTQTIRPRFTSSSNCSPTWESSTNTWKKTTVTASPCGSRPR